MRALQAIIATLALGAVPGAVMAQDYPSRPIEIVVPFSPGGSTDLSARIFAEGLQEKLGVPVRVTNLTGGQTLPAVEDVRNAAPDGYKLLLDGQSQTVLLEQLVPDLPFDIMDRTFIAETVLLNNVMYVRPDSPFETLGDVVETLQADPAAVSWGSLGGTGLSDTGFLRLFNEAGVNKDDTREVVFSGGAEVVVQVAGGHVDLGISSPTSLKPYVEAGQLRALTVLGNSRNVLYPDTPTSEEDGFPGVTAVQWNGISGPAGMDPAVVEILHSAVQELLADDAFVAQLTNIGLDPYPSEIGDMEQLVAAEREQVQQLFGATEE